MTHHYLEIERCVKCPDTGEWTSVLDCEYDCTCFDKYKGETIAVCTYYRSDVIP